MGSSPVTTRYHGYDVWELPPNGQGMIALMALNILSGIDLPSLDDPLCWHRQIEALKLAAVDAYRYVADPRFMELSPAALLDPAYAARRRALIGERALLPEAGLPTDGGTVYLCTADQEGNMVSFIQSNFSGFGSGVVVPGTGIAIHNRGTGFYLDQESPNCLAPGKRPFHTIIPGFLSKDGQPVGPFGVMGAFMQPQGHLQVLLQMIDYGRNPQSALDAPRWFWTGEKQVSLEHGVPLYIARALADRGHEVSYSGCTRPLRTRPDHPAAGKRCLCRGNRPRAPTAPPPRGKSHEHDDGDSARRHRRTGAGTCFCTVMEEVMPC